MTMQKFKTQNGLTLGGDLVDEETGEIISIDTNDFIVNGKHIQAGFGTWLREDSAGSRQVGFDATTSTKLDFYVGGAVEASLTASGLTGLENLTLADNKNLYLGTGNDFRLYFDGANTIFNAVAGDLKIQDNGTDRYTFSTTNGDLSITGDFSQHNVKTYTFSRTIPASTGDIVELGSHSFTNGGGFIEITAIVADSAYSVSKQYRIPVAFAQETAWCIVQPLFDSGGYSTETGNDFQLEFQITTSQCFLRARRASGATAGSIDFVMTVYSADGDSNTFSESSTTSTETEPTIYHNAAIMTMHDDYVGINGQVDITKAFNNADDAVGSINLLGATGNYIYWGTPGVATPTLATRSAGTKAVWFPSLSSSQVDYATGITSNTLWNSVPGTSQQFAWYAGTTEIATLDGSGNLAVDGSATASSFVKSGGTSSQFLKADGSVDSTAYTDNTGTVTSVATSGTVNGLTLTGGTITTTGTVTLGGTLAINNSDWSGTDLAVVNGGTGASDAASARTNLGLGTGNSPTFTNVTASGHFEGPAEHSSTTSGTLAAGDMNTTISATGGITINNSIGSQGDIVIIYNNTAGNITLTQGTGVTLRLAGSTSTGNRTVATRGLACVYYHAANDVIVGGTGVT